MTETTTKTGSRVKKLLIASGVLILFLLIVPPLLQPVGLEPTKTSAASIRVYGANVWGLRGYFAIHTWIATRSAVEEHYQIHQVIGWRLRRTGTALTYHEGDPDRPWFGNDAILLHELTGADAETAIPGVRAAIKSYPFAKTIGCFPVQTAIRLPSGLPRKSPNWDYNCLSRPSVACGCATTTLPTRQSLRTE